MTGTPTTIEEGTLKRSIQMKMFNSKEITRKVIAENKSITLGQLICEIYEVKEKMGTLPDGTPKMSLIAYGEFEAINYETGEVFKSAAAYLPGYYLEVVKSMLAKNQSGTIVAAIEIVLSPTGKSIPTGYEVRNLARRHPGSPLDEMKRQLQKADRLKLPPPPVELENDGHLLTYEDATDPADNEDVPDPTETAKAEMAEKKSRARPA